MELVVHHCFDNVLYSQQTAAVMTFSGINIQGAVNAFEFLKH